MGLGVVRLEADGLPVGGDRLVSSLFLERDAEVVVGLGEVRLEADGLAEGGDGLVQSPLCLRTLPRLQWASA